VNLVELRNLDLARYHQNRLKLDLGGFTVITECASKAYAYTPVMAAMAGAKVIAVGRDSSYGLFEENRDFIQKLLGNADCNDRVEFVKGALEDKVIKRGDIFTNSGFLRPFSANVASVMKHEAVLCLMWEAWEVRQGEIDISAFQQRRIPVIGTNESSPVLKMLDYPGTLALKLLFETGCEVANNHIVLLGSGLTGREIARYFRKTGISFDWISNEKSGKESVSYTNWEKILDLPRVDAILAAEHSCPDKLAGQGGFLNLSRIKEKFPFVKWAHLSGNMNREELVKVGIDTYPAKFNPFGYMTYETVNLGWEPAIILNAAGLKVGEIAAKARKSGKSPEAAIAACVEHGIGQDFPGGFFNFNFNRD
jgi:hypothetical protein